MSNPSRAPGLGAGFAAAQTAASAAAIVAEVARRSSDSWAGASATAAQAAALSARCSALADADAEAFGVALAALEEGSPDLVARLEGAAEVPLEIAGTAADVAQAALLVAERCDGHLRADAIGAAALAAGAALAAARLVRANLVVPPDDPRVARAFRAADDARYAASRALDSDV